MRKFAAFLMLLCTTTLAAQNVVYDEIHIFTGKLNGKIAFELAFVPATQNGEMLHAGYIYYPNAKNPAPVLVVGHELQADTKDPAYENLEHIAFTEYQPDGEITGKIDLEYYEVEGDYTFKKGTWTNPGNGRRFQMTNMGTAFNAPSWWPGIPATLNSPRREDYTYKYHFKKDENGNLENITVDLFANGKKMGPEIKESYTYPFSEDQNLDWVTETDVNFDGIPDLYIFIGFQSHAQSAYAAYVWNPDTRQFYNVDAFYEIAEPEFDNEHKTIISRARDNDYMYEDTFKWKNGKLRRISSRKISLFD